MSKASVAKSGLAIEVQLQVVVSWYGFNLKGCPFWILEMLADANFGHPKAEKGTPCHVELVKSVGSVGSTNNKSSHNSYAVRSKWESPPENAENDEAGKADLDWLRIYATRLEVFRHSLSREWEEDKGLGFKALLTGFRLRPGAQS